MGLTYLAGPRARSRIREAREFLLDLPAGQPFLVVGHRRHPADRLCHEVAERREALFGAHRCGFLTLAETLAAPGLARRRLTPLTPAARLGLVAEGVHQAREEGTLDRLTRVAGGPGLARRLAATFDELRLAEIAPEPLERLDPAVGRLYAGYVEALSSGRFADRAEALRIACARIEEPGAASSHPIGLPTVFLDVRLHHQASRPFAKALCARSPAVLWTLPHGDTETEQALRDFGGAPHPAGGVPSASRRVRAPASGSRRESALASGSRRESALAAAQRRLFTTDDDASRPLEPDSVRVIAAPGANAEALEAVRICLDAARDGAPFDRMAVLLPGRAALQASRFPPAFQRAGIPAFFDFGDRKPNPAGRAFLALLDCALDDFSVARFAEYLSLGQAPAPPDRPAASPRRWEEILLDASVLRGADRWESRLGARIQELAGLERKEANDSARRERRDLESLRQVALPIIRRLDALRWKRRPWEAWIERLRDLARTALREPDIVVERLERTGPAAAGERADLEDIRDHLGRRLTEIPTRSSGSRYGRVWVGPIEAARGLSFDVVVVPGVVEHGFPRVVRQDPLLRDRIRARLEKTLPRLADWRERERLLLRIAVGAATRRLVLGYSSLNLVEARPQAPSYYLAEVLRAARGKSHTLRMIRDDAERTNPMVPGVRAPEGSGRALDLPEFGLSRVMAALGSDRRDPQPGAAAFVLREPFLARALRQEWMREQRKWTAADGFVLRGDSETAKALERHRPGAHPYSATGLQNFAECPYRFFLKNVLRMRRIDRPEPRAYLDPLTRGSLAHDVLFHVGQDLRPLAPLTPEKLEEALDIVERRFREVAAELRERAAPPVDSIWRDEMAGIRAEIREVVRRFAEERITPEAAELSFGLSSLRTLKDPASVPDPVTLPGGLQLRGSIDLVERLEGGELRVTDYKTGKARFAPARDWKILFGGRGLQPLLYALALEEMAGRAVPKGRLYYATVRGQFSEAEVDTGAARARNSLAAFLGELDQAIRLGRFPAAPHRSGFKMECDWCDYQGVCGPRPKLHHLRKPKTAKALDPVNAVRAMP